MHFYACTGCVAEKTDCEHRARIKAAVAKMGVRSVRHTCKARVPLYRPGDAVFVETCAEVGASEEEFFVSWFPGVILDVTYSGKCLVFVKDGTLDETGEAEFIPSRNGVVKAPLSRVKPRPGVPPVDVSPCRWCAAVTSVGQQCGRDPHYTPLGDCQAAQRAEAA